MAEVEAAARDGVIADVVIPFNGVLVTRELVERIGLPREEFFIWGDDVEYLWRARKAGARTATVVAARFLHPPPTTSARPWCSAGRRTTTAPATSSTTAWRATTSSTSATTAAGPRALAFVAKTAWFYSFTRPTPAPPAAQRPGDAAPGCAATSPATGGTSVAEPAETVAVVVVTHNRADLLARMLDGLVAQTHPPDAVIVVDNASGDHTSEVLARARPAAARSSGARRTSAARAASGSAWRRRTTRASTASG